MDAALPRLDPETAEALAEDELVALLLERLRAYTREGLEVSRALLRAVTPDPA
jgi:DNA repair protein RadC